MNVVQLLTPKSAVAYLNEKMTLRQALEKMENHRYTCVPILVLLLSSGFLKEFRRQKQNQDAILCKCVNTRCRTARLKSSVRTPKLASNETGGAHNVRNYCNGWKAV